MNRITDAVLLLLTIVAWVVAVVALVESDGICPGVCEGCVYAGWCPQERK